MDDARRALLARMTKRLLHAPIQPKGEKMVQYNEELERDLRELSKEDLMALLSIAYVAIVESGGMLDFIIEVDRLLGGMPELET